MKSAWMHAMYISSVSLRHTNVDASVTAGPITVLSGRWGKSMTLNVLYTTLSRMGRVITPLHYPTPLRLRLDFRLDGDWFSMTLDVERDRIAHVYSYKDAYMVLESVKLGGKIVHRLREPISIDLRKANYLLNGKALVPLNPSSEIVVGEQLEELKRVMEDARRRLSVETMYIGPYIDPPSVGDADSPIRRNVGRHGEHLPIVLSYMQSAMPGRLRHIEMRLRHVGVKRIICGWRGRRRLYVGVEMGGTVVPIDKAPCTVKTALVHMAQLSIMGRGVLIVENFDYCMSEAALTAISPMLRDFIQRGGQLFFEVRSQAVLDSLKTEYSVINIIE